MSKSELAEQPAVMTLLAPARNSNAPIFTNLVWLSGMAPSYSSELQVEYLKVAVVTAKMNTLPIDTSHALEVHCDPLYWSVRFELSKDEAVGFARAIALKLGTVSLIQMKMVGCGHGVEPLGTIAVQRDSYDSVSEVDKISGTL